jgi:hypothetical protein
VKSLDIPPRKTFSNKFHKFHKEREWTVRVDMTSIYEDGAFFVKLQPKLHNPPLEAHGC